MSLKNPVTPPGIVPGTARLEAQRLNHYATPDPSSGNYFPVNSYKLSLPDLLSPILWEIYPAAKIIRILKASSG